MFDVATPPECKFLFAERDYHHSSMTLSARRLPLAKQHRLVGEMCAFYKNQGNIDEQKNLARRNASANPDVYRRLCRTWRSQSPQRRFAQRYARVEPL